MVSWNRKKIERRGRGNGRGEGRTTSKTREGRKDGWVRKHWMPLEDKAAKTKRCSEEGQMKQGGMRGWWGQYELKGKLRIKEERGARKNKTELEGETGLESGREGGRED